jgi:hypothetical protein
MDGILRWLSAGALADVVARATGWSPVGRRITLCGAEGPGAELLEGRTARVTAILGGEMIAELLPGHERRAEGLDRVRLTPRHSGWTPFSLMLTGIAVVVQEDSQHAGSGPVGIAMARLARNTSAEQ